MNAFEGEGQLLRAARAGLAYAILAFGVGFALGTVRVLVVAPRVGPTAAVLIESPLILGASWWISLRCVAHFRVGRAVTARLVMGLTAFLVLMLAEVSLSAVLLGRPITEYLASLAALPGAIGLTAQVAFAGFPLVQAGLTSPDR